MNRLGLPKRVISERGSLIRFPLSFDWHLHRYKGGDGYGREERSRCFNLGLGRGHCNRSSIGRRVHNILEAIKPGTEDRSGTRSLVSGENKQKIRNITGRRGQ